MMLKKGELCCLAASALILIFFGSHKQPQVAVSAADEVSSLTFSDLFKSLFQQNSNFIGSSAAAADTSSDGTYNIQEYSSKRHPTNERHRHPNRRLMLYDLSVRSHYERMMQQKREGNKTSTDKTNEDIFMGGFHQNPQSSRVYYNQGLDFSFDVREMIRRDENLFAQFSHWTFELSRRKSLSQIHLEPVPLGGDDDGGSMVKDDVLRLPSTSLLANDILFSVPVINKLGTYVDADTSMHDDFDSLIKSAVDGSTDEPSNQIEYYKDGDLCTYKILGQHPVTIKRQSVVIYNKSCCKRQRRTMDEFFQQDDKIMILGASEPKPCRYVLRACNICQSGMSRNALATNDDIHSFEEPLGFRHLLQSYINLPPSKHEVEGAGGHSFPPMPPSQIEANKQLLKKMFTHAWDSYMYNAFPASELQPLTCQPGTFNLVRIPALTLIDALDTLIIMNNYTEFARSVERLRFLDERMKREFQEKGMTSNLRKGEEGGIFSVNQNVSVFETTIRVLGGLLSAHQLAEAFMKKKVLISDVWDSSGDVIWGPKDSEKHESQSQSDNKVDEQSCSWDDSSSSIEMEEDVGCAINDESNETEWAYDGFLLKLAHDIGDRLLYAFDTESGIPYGTVNLLHGVPPQETTVASLAGAGTLTLEFELLARLTGNLKFGKAAKLATRALWVRRSKDLNLFGKHIDGKSGKWVEYLSGVGSNSDSFYEYLVKHYILFPDDADFWLMFVNVYAGVYDNSRLGEWYVDVDMRHGLGGHVRQIFESLMAFYPGMQILLGEVAPAAKTLNSFFLVREYLGLLPERFDIVHWKVDGSGDIHPLRPELLESNYFLHLASIGLHGSKNGPCSQKSSSPHTSSWLWAADFALHTVNKLSWRPCGYATVKKVSPTTTGGLDLVQGSHDPEAEQKRRYISHDNEMPSFFLSETIKYLYLTFDAENNVLHQDSEREWVFTTEAHPIHHAPVSSTPVLSSEDTGLGTQIDQVRSLLKSIISNASTDNKATEKAQVKNGTKHLTFEQWTANTKKSTHTNSIATVKDDVMTRKREAMRQHGLVSGPYFQRGELYNNSSFFFEDVNYAHHQFDSHGKGRGIGKRCPNLHHPDLLWTHALNGNTLDYNTEHQSSFSNEMIEVKGGRDRRMLSAFSAVCFFGTDYYLDGIDAERVESCPATEDPLLQELKAQQDEFERLNRADIPGSKRYDMGGDMGMVDVSAFENGDGFVVRHVNSGELLEVSIFYDDLDDLSNTAEEDGNDDNDEDEDEGDDDAEILPGATILVVLTLPVVPEASKLSQHYYKKNTSLSSWTLSGWRKQLTSDKNASDITDERQNDASHIAYHRNVVVADLEGNSFSCKVILIEESNESHNFPCAPSFFGKADIAALAKSEGAFVSGQLSPPPMGDELGCEPLPLEDYNFCNNMSISEENKNVLQLIRRGECNFIEKATNQASRRNAAAMIVVNSSPNELFAMSGNDSGTSIEVECSSEDLPLSVMVNGADGDSIINLLESQIIKETRVELKPILEDVEYFPQVIGSEQTLRITAQSGWGTHAVRQTLNGGRAWQLFILSITNP